MHFHQIHFHDSFINDCKFFIFCRIKILLFIRNRSEGRKKEGRKEGKIEGRKEGRN